MSIHSALFSILLCMTSHSVFAAQEDNTAVTKPARSPEKVKTAKSATLSSRMELSDLAEIVSNRTGRKLILDPSVRGLTAIIPVQSLEKDELWKAFLIALAQNGYSIVETQGFVQVLPARTAAKSGVPTVESPATVTEERMITWTYRPQHMKAVDFIKDLGRLASPNGTVDIYAPNNTLIFTDFTSSLQRIQTLVSSLDKTTK